MGGIVIALGDFWKVKSIDWAVGKVGIFGAPRRLIASPDVTIIAFGDVETSEDERTLVLGYEVTPDEFRDAEKAYRDGSIRKGSIRRWDRGMIVAFDKKERSLYVLKGEMSDETFYYASQGASFFGASLLKAFSNLDSVKDVHSLEEGQSLSRSFADAEPKIESRLTDWKFTPNPMPYEEAVAKFRDTLTELVREYASGLTEKPALCLSGGIDSCVLAQLLTEQGTQYTSYHVTFDQEGGSGEAPGDLHHARVMAKHLGIDLVEIHVTEKQLYDTLDELIYTSETPNILYIVASVYYMPLVRALRSGNFNYAFHGDGSDRALGGHKFVIEDPREDEYERRYFMMLKKNDSQSASRKHFLTGGIKLLSPFSDRRLVDWIIPLPKSYKLGASGVPGEEKRILRDAFNSRLPREIAERPKGLPWKNSNLRPILARDFPTRHDLVKHLTKKFKHLLKPVSL